MSMAISKHLPMLGWITWPERSPTEPPEQHSISSSSEPACASVQAP